MPTETARVVARKTIKLPSGGEIDIPVISKITFRDQTNRGQETEITYDNSDASTKRKVDIVTISSETAATPPTEDDSLKTEYVKSYTTKDSVDRGQEAVRSMDNTDVPPSQHFKVQYVRYYPGNDKESATYVDMQQILEYHEKDEINRSQQTYYTMNGWDTVGSDDPKNPTDGFCDPSLPLLDYTSSGVIDPPWRFDPLQVLVNFSDLPPGNIMAIGSQYLSDFTKAGIQLDRKTGAVLKTYDSSEYLVWWPSGSQQYPAGTNDMAAIDQNKNAIIGSYSYGRNTDLPLPDNTRGRNSSLQYYAPNSSGSPTWVGSLVGQAIVEGGVGFDTKGNSYQAAGLGTNEVGLARTDARIYLTKYSSTGTTLWSTFLVAGGGLDEQVGISQMNVLLDGTVILNYGTTTAQTLNAFDGSTGTLKWALSGDFYPASNVGFRSKTLLLSATDVAKVVRIDSTGHIDLTLSGPWGRVQSADIGQDGKIYVLGQSGIYTGLYTIYQFSNDGILLNSTTLGFVRDGPTNDIINIVSPGKDIVAVCYAHLVEALNHTDGFLIDFSIFTVYGFETTNLTQKWQTTYSEIAPVDRGDGSSSNIAGVVSTLGRGP